MKTALPCQCDWCKEVRAPAIVKKKAEALISSWDIAIKEDKNQSLMTVVSERLEDLRKAL